MALVQLFVPGPPGRPILGFLNERGVALLIARKTEIEIVMIKKDAQEVVQDTVTRLLENEARVIEAVKRGIASADRGDLLEHDEVVARVERLLRP